MSHPLSQVVHAMFEAPLFQPAKLTVSMLPGTSCSLPSTSRRYTLTHNDITGELWLSIGNQYNRDQISGFYTRLLRDEVTAEWRQVGQSHQLHVFCHVSGEERWLAPPFLRNYIFRREMALVLDCMVYADRDLFESSPSLLEAEVFVHFQSSVAELDRTENWGQLGDRDSWTKTESILKRVLLGLVGQSPELRPERSESEVDRAHDGISRLSEQGPTSSPSRETSSTPTTTFKILNQSSQIGLVSDGNQSTTGLDGIALDDLLPRKKRPLLASQPIKR